MTSAVSTIVSKLPEPSSSLTTRVMCLSSILRRNRCGIRSMNCSPASSRATFPSSKTWSVPGRPRAAPVMTTGS